MLIAIDKLVRLTSLALIAFALMSTSNRSVALPGEWMPEALFIESIIIEGDYGGRATIVIKGGVPQAYIPAACHSPYNQLDLSTSKGRAQLSTVMLAYSLGKPVRLALQCIGDRPLISHIWLS